MGSQGRVGVNRKRKNCIAIFKSKMDVLEALCWPVVGKVAVKNFSFVTLQTTIILYRYTNL